MPNSGDTDPADRLGPVGGSDAVAPSEATEAASEAGAVQGPAAAEAAAAAPQSGSTQAIAAALASGAIDSQTARTQLIDAAVRTRVPPDASPEAVAAIRAEVETLLGENPLIQQWLRP
ncbi:MAG: hypothetical protein AAF799_40510 [Myxococcota bacterium]